MSVLSGVSLAQLDESFRGCGRGHGVVDISAAAALAVPRLVDCAPRAQSGASRGQLVLIAHVEIDGVAMAIVVSSLGILSLALIILETSLPRCGGREVPSVTSACTSAWAWQTS